jgi:hypothetical protein
MSYASSAVRRAPFVLAALAMTALTLGLTIVAPATLDSGFAEVRATSRNTVELASRCPCVDPAWVHSAVLRTTAADAGCRQST